MERSPSKRRAQAKMGTDGSKPVQVQAVTKETILEAVQIDGLALEKYSKRNDDYVVVLAAVSQNGPSLKFASGNLNDHYDIVLAAVRQNGTALDFAMRVHKTHPDFTEAAKLQIATAHSETEAATKVKRPHRPLPGYFLATLWLLSGYSLTHWNPATPNLRDRSRTSRSPSPEPIPAVSS